MMPSNATLQSNTEEGIRQSMMRTVSRKSTNLSNVKGPTTDSLQSPRDSIAQKLDKKTFTTNPSAFARGQTDSVKPKGIEDEIESPSTGRPKSTFRGTKAQQLNYGISKREIFVVLIN